MSKKMNVVLFSFDDAVSFWHYKKVFGAELQTPTLDEICEHSTAFHAAYCQSPVCNTSRASFMTGKSPHQIDYVDPWDREKGNVFSFVDVEEMWSWRVKQAGYYCSSGGKVHHGFKPLAPDVHKHLYSDERKIFHADISMPASFEQNKTGGYGEGHSTLDPKNDHFYYDATSAQSFIDFIDSYDGDAPFYREVGFYSPHSPFITPIRFKDMYRPNTIHTPKSWEEGFELSPFAQQNISMKFKHTGTRYWKKSIRNYFAAYSHGDFNLGKVWRALKNSRFAENTIFIILTDHGMHLGDRDRFGKSTIWEQTALVPMIIHDPRCAEPRVIHDPVGLIDVGPTILDYIGLDPIKDSPGRSLANVVAGGPADPDRAVPTFNQQGSAIRKGDYRFIQYIDGSTEMYDLRNDWWQQKILGPEHPAYQDNLKALHDCCKDYGQKVLPEAR